MKQIKPLDPNGYPIPRQEQCFRCQQLFWLKFVLPQKNYSQKNNWGYWTNQIKDAKKWICNLCLRNFYLEDRANFLTAIKDLKKRNHLRSYVSHKII